MRLVTIDNGSRDGRLAITDKNNILAVYAEGFQTLQQALDNWDSAKTLLQQQYDDLNSSKLAGAFPLADATLHSPLPRAYQWVDGSAYLNHVELVRKARGAVMPPEFLHDPLMYQGCSDGFLRPNDPIAFPTEDYGIDYEAEVAVITGDVPMGITPEAAGQYIRLIVIVNDVSLRNLIPAELAKGFGFFQSKPASSFAPVALTPDEFSNHWRDGKLSLPLKSWLNGKLCGEPNAGVDMQFSFHQLIAHAARTRKLAAGTIIGSGTISNYDRSKGFSCLAEIRMIETIETGGPQTPFMKFGDNIRITMTLPDGSPLFGEINQTVEKAPN